jgi:DNA mismatch repair protein MutS
MPEDAPATKKARPGRLAPGRQQYLQFRQQYPDALLLFRMGDFYETFDDDARTMARVLDIALTARDVGGGVKAPLAGIPHHALEAYLGRLVEAGFKVAICEQTSDPAASRGIVDRAVVRIVTPGTVAEPGLLDQRQNNFLAAAVADENSAGLARLDVTTSEFVTSQLSHGELRDEINRLRPAELLADEAALRLLDGLKLDRVAVRPLDASRLDPELASDALLRHFQAATLEPFGCVGKPMAAVAAAAVLEYLKQNQLGTAPQVTSLRTVTSGDHLRLDHRALRDLEVFEPLGGRPGAPTLLSVVDRTRTAMGGRLLRAWLGAPLMDIAALQSRQDAVGCLAGAAVARGTVREALGRVPDLERLTNRVRTFTATPRDVAALGRGLAAVPELARALDATGGSAGGPADSAVARTPAVGWGARWTSLQPCEDAAALISAAIADGPPVTAGDGSAIRPGFDRALDEVRSLSGEARSHIAAIEAEARERTGIKSLKVGYNKVFGYYIEVSKSNLARVPSEWERRQTLVNGERFVTPALKEYESQVLTARDRISDLERALFRRVCAELAVHAGRIMASARAIAEIDALASLAEVAAGNGWVRPALDQGDTVRIKGGRHPIVEAALGPGRFVPNDTELSNSGEQVLIITGPNMSGKSTYIRQVAALVLLAQTGSFIPAESARIGVVDRIFTRAGLSDDIAGGRSTFMTEMVETAAVLNQATPRSLAVLDEIGRGTSTYDGLAIARAVAEHIHNNPRISCKTLFATHYHEMTALADVLPRAANYRVAVSEEGSAVVFLHRIVPGGADRSYGVHVARLAGLPLPVITRAWQLLEEMEKGAGRPVGGAGGKSPGPARDGPAAQLALFPAFSPVLAELAGLDVNSMTPLDALNALFRLQERARGPDGPSSPAGKNSPPARPET